MISILTPTRNRPNNCERFIKSIYQTTKHRGNIELLFYVDKDDPSMGSYMSLQRHCFDEYNKFVRVQFNFGDPVPVCDSWNLMAKVSMGDVIIMGNDDLIYRTPEWDSILMKELSPIKDNIYCAWVNDGINQDKHCAFPIISRKWIETLGYCFAPEGTFNFGYNDTWVFDIGKRVGRLKYIPNILVEHMHFSKGKAEMDDTYARNRTQERGNLYQKDLIIYNSDTNVTKRILSAKKLEGVIDK
jgi:glycosyl transferase/beta-hydroxylase protein BlmF